MFNPEKLSSTPETTAETPRETLQARGDKTYQAAQIEQMTRAEAEQYRAQLERENEAARARLAALRGEETQAKAELEDLGKQELEASEAAATPEAAVPEANPVSEASTAPEAELTPTPETVLAPDNASEFAPDDDTEAAPISGEAIAATAEKAKKSESFKQRMKRAAWFVLPLALAAVIAIGVGVHNHNKDNQASSAPSEPTEQVTVIGETHEARGIYDGYGEKGMWLSENKSGPLNFACATEVAEVCHNNEKETVKYTSDNQVESFADYLSALPEFFKNMLGFGGMNLKTCEATLEGLSDADYDATKEAFDDIIDQATVDPVTLNGSYQNAYMDLQDQSGDVVHENMQLVGCKTTERGFNATRFTWYDDDGNEIGSMIVKIKHDAKGNIIGGCMQVVEKEGETDRLEDLPTVPDEDPDDDPDDEKPSDDTPDDDTPNDDTPNDDTPNDDTPNDDTPDDDTPDWGKSGDPHGGDDVTPSDEVNPDSEVTQEENDSTNQDNQGYVDDHQATPGSPSENNGTDNQGFSPITAPGASTDEERLPGGANQGTNETAGENAYFSEEEISAGQEIDKTGNQAQQQSQENGGFTPGADNNSNAAEEAAVANGDF